MIHSNIFLYLVEGLSGNFSVLDNLVFFGFLLAPLMGYLGERWIRYKVLIASVFMIIIFANMFYVLEIIAGRASNLLSNHSVLEETLEVVTGIVDLIQNLGILLFTANIIQFGTDQLQGASSVKLSLFARWYIIIYFTPISINYFIALLGEIGDYKDEI